MLGMNDSKSERHWYIAVAQAGRTNLQRGLRAAIWGAKDRGKFTDVRFGEIGEGDIVHFFHEIHWGGQGASPQGFPRVSLDQYIAQANETVVEVTGSIFEDSSEIWDDDLYPVRFSFVVQRNIERVRLAPDMMEDSVRDAVRLSGISQGKAVLVNIQAGGGTLPSALSRVLDQYLEARREPFPQHSVFALINRDLPLLLEQLLSLDMKRYRILASAGQGNWAMVPWVAILDQRRGGTIQNGLYLALLFQADMAQVVFALMFGVSGDQEASLPNARARLASRVESLQAQLAIDPSLWQMDHRLKLSVQGIGSRYGEGVVAYRAHAADQIPTETELGDELKALLQLYDRALTMISAPVESAYAETNVKTKSSPVAQESSPPYRRRPFVLESVYAQIAAVGYRMTLDDLVNVLVAIQVRPFVIFSGRSGTGKTTLSRILGRLFGWHYTQIAVSPAWADPADLIGFISPVNQKRVDGALTNLLLGDYQETLLCLDEFNVAKVEHYFSDFISAMDSDRDEGFWGTLPSLERLYPNAVGQPRLPSRFVVLATMNFDDSVQSITPRVLDRANVIEFDIAGVNDLIVGEVLTWAALDPVLPFAWPWASEELPRDALGEETVRSLWQALYGTRGQFGHRAAQEMAQYIAYGLGFASSLGRTPDAQRRALIDRQIVQRLLPKFHGTAMARDIAGLMKLLAVLLDQKGRLPDDQDRQELIDQVANQGQFPRTAAKIQQLVSSYVEDGYASFW